MFYKTIAMVNLEMHAINAKKILTSPLLMNMSSHQIFPAVFIALGLQKTSI